MTPYERATRVIRARDARWVLTKDLRVINSFNWDLLVELVADQIAEAVYESMVADLHNRPGHSGCCHEPGK